MITHIIEQFRGIQDGNPWIGSCYRKKLMKLDETSAFIQPIDGLHSVAEILSHLTMWRKETILKMKTGTGSKTDESEDNWLPNKTLKKLGWRYIQSEYQQTLTEMIALLETKEDRFLEEQYYDTDFKGYYSYRFVINGMLHHDIYHLGQIGIVLKFL